MAKKPKPQIVLSSSQLANLDEESAQTVQAISKLSHSQRAVLGATIHLDGCSSTKAAGSTYYSKSAAHNAFNRLEKEGLITIEDGWPSIAHPTEAAREAAETLDEEFDFQLEEYLYSEDEEDEQEQEQEQEQEDETPSAGTDPMASISSGSASVTESGAQASSNSGSSSGSASSGSGQMQGFGERPAAFWDSEAEDVPVEEIGSRVGELAAEMLSKAEQPRMSNLERERVRAEQAKAAALLMIAGSQDG